MQADVTRERTRTGKGEQVKITFRRIKRTGAWYAVLHVARNRKIEYIPNDGTKETARAMAEEDAKNYPAK